MSIARALPGRRQRGRPRIVDRVEQHRRVSVAPGRHVRPLGQVCQRPAGHGGDSHLSPPDQLGGTVQLGESHLDVEALPHLDHLGGAQR
jgi:hypothetical protein